MDIVYFPGHNTVFAKDQPQYRPLPAYKYITSAEGRIVFCWELTLRERIKLLFCGRVWHSVLTFDQPLQPQLLSVDAPDLSA